MGGKSALVEIQEAGMRWEDLESGLVSKLVSLFEPFNKLTVVGFAVTSKSPVFLLSSEECAQIIGIALPFARALFVQCATRREVWMKMSTLENAWLVTRTLDGPGALCPSDDCNGHLLYVPTRTSLPRIHCSDQRSSE